MFGKAFQKGFVSGFLSPFTFFLPPEKAKRKIFEFKEYKPADLPDVSAAAAWRRVNERLSQAIQKNLSPFPQHLAHYQKHCPNGAMRLAELEKLSKLLEAPERRSAIGEEKATEGEKPCRKRTKMMQAAQREI